MKVILFLFLATLKPSALTQAEKTVGEDYEPAYYKTDFLKLGDIPTKSREVAALGRVADLGDLYDARSDNFLDISLYTSNIPDDVKHTTDQAYSKIAYVSTESLSEKFEKLKVSPSLSISILGGMVNVFGSGEYLNDEKKSFKSAKASLIYSIRTAKENLKILSDSSRNLIDTYLLENMDATHVVVGIEWGADVVLSLEETNTDSIDAQAMQEKLEETLKQVALAISDPTGDDFAGSDVEYSGTFRLYINGDIIPSAVPQTLNELVAFIKDLPNFLKDENSGKGKIVKYVLMPLATIQKVFKIMSNNTGDVEDIPQELVGQLIQIFQEIKNSELKINDVFKSLSKWSFLVSESELEVITEAETRFKIYENDLREVLAGLMVQYRNQDINEEPLDAFITSYKSSNWTSASIDKFLDIFTSTVRKTRLLDLFQSFNAIFIHSETDKYKILADNYEKEAGIISMDLNIDISSSYVQDIIRLLEDDFEYRTYYIENAIISTPEVKIYKEGNVIKSFLVGKREYVFIKSNTGNIIVIDADSYQPIVSYALPEISTCAAVIFNDTFYKIDFLKGEMMSTALKNIMIGPNAINWTKVASFPLETYYNYNAATVKDSFIYFVSPFGILYSYDLTLKTVTKLVELSHTGNNYASMIFVNNILYIHKYLNFYSFDGVKVSEITTPDVRAQPGLFQSENLICYVGGNYTVILSNPVQCYNPNDGTWAVSSYIDDFRRAPGVATTEAGTLVIGGSVLANGTNSWLNSTIIFDHKTKVWSYAPSPLVNEPVHQAITFYF